MLSPAGGHGEVTKKLIELGADVHAIARATQGYSDKLKKNEEEGIPIHAYEQSEKETMTAIR